MRQSSPVHVQAPHSWDGIGQALRAAYRSHREAPEEMARILNKLDRID